VYAVELQGRMISARAFAALRYGAATRPIEKSTSSATRRDVAIMTRSALLLLTGYAGLCLDSLAFAVQHHTAIS
jgi:hypothetical protein